MLNRSKATWLSIAGLFVLFISFAGTQHVPLYDGIGFPDEPYRRAVKDGDKQPSKPASSINFTSQIGLPSGDTIYLNSDEQGPQVVLGLEKKSLTFPLGAKEYTIKVVPSAPTTQLKDGSYLGNIYTLSATSDAGEVAFTPNPSNAIGLRLPKSNGLMPTMQYSKDGTSWKKLQTTQSGNDTYTSPLLGYGQYVLTSSQASISKTKANYSKIIVGLIIGAVLIGIVLILRRNTPVAKG